MPAFPATADAVIIGGGIIGLTTALELSRAGLSICVVERGELGRQCSWAGGGMLTSLPPDMPTPELQPLLQQSLNLFPDFCSELEQETGIDPEYWICGARLMVQDAVQEWPAIAQVRNPRLLKALRRALEQRGVQLLEQTEVLGWRLEQNRLVGVRTSRGNIACAQTVLAAGAWSGQLAPVSIGPAKGQMLLLQGRPGLLNHILIGEHAYLIPRRDGRVLLGSTIEDAGYDTTPTVEARALLIESGLRLWPHMAGLHVQDQWAGLRPRGVGNVPIIQAASHIEGLFYNTGHFRLGITLAPASAQQLGILMLARR